MKFVSALEISYNQEHNACASLCACKHNYIYVYVCTQQNFRDIAKKVDRNVVVNCEVVSIAGSRIIEKMSTNRM
jgi:hypothetical protein